MPIQQIGERILVAAREEAALIKRKATQTAETTGAKAEERAQAYLESALSKARLSAEQERMQILAAARLSARDQVIRAKQEALDAVFKSVRSKVRHLPADAYIQFLTAKIVAHTEGGENVIFDPSDQKITAVIIKTANETLKGLKKSGIHEGGGRTIGGGFILVGDGVEQNFSLDQILEQARENLNERAASLLFGEND